MEGGIGVGGTTTVNWTSSFRTPDATLDYWGTKFGVKSVTPADMAPWFARMEQRLNIHKWPMPPNTNNNILRTSCEKLGFSWDIIPRNVNGCWNLGYCGLGCPTNAKQSMLVTTLPAALAKGAQLLWRLRAERVVLQRDRATGGDINTPELMLRSQLPDPHQRIGKRTFLHVVPGVFAQFPEAVDPYYGAPQSVYSDQFQWQNVSDEPVGFKLEVMPMHPGLFSALLGSHGEQHVEAIRALPRSNGMLAMLRDGFHEQSPGGSVSLTDLGTPVLDYPVRAGSTTSTRRARPLPPSITSRVHRLRDLSVFDGSLFPTSIGANPQLSIYGLVSRLASALAAELKPA